MSYTEQLERDTERTRLELANTIGELCSRLTPGQVLDEMLDYASDGDVADYLRSFKRQIINNPLPLGLMGASMAWLVVASAFGRRGDGRTSRARAADLAADARARGSDPAGSVQAAAADMAASARQAVNDLGDRATEVRVDATNWTVEVAQDTRAAAARVGNRMRDAASTAGTRLAAAGDTIADSANRRTEAIGRVASEIGRNSRAASRAMSDFGHEQPLIVAAAGLVLGAIIGAVLPSTETEDRLIGDSSDAAKEKLREMAGEQYAKAKDIAARTAEAALAASGAVDSSSRDDAEKHDGGEFGSGPGYHSDAQNASGEHSAEAQEAEHRHAGGA